MTPDSDASVVSLQPSGDRPPLRRAEDDPTTIVLLGPHGLAALASPAGVTLLEGDEATAVDVSALTTPERMREYAFLVDLGGEEAVLLGAMGAYPIARGAGGEELLLRAAGAAAAWRRAERRLAHRLSVPDWLVGYADALSSAGSAGDVHVALATFAHRVVGAYATLVLVQSAQGETGEVIRQGGRTAAPAALAGRELARLARPGILTSSDLNGHAALRALWAGMGAVYVLHAPLNPGAFVFLIERRHERVFTAEDSDLFHALVRQAQAVLRRLDSSPPAAAAAPSPVTS